MRKCVINKKTDVCVNVILLEDGETFNSTSADEVLASRHDGELGWQLVNDEWIYETPEPVLPSPPTAEQQEARRKAAYIAESDPIFFKYQRDESTKEQWLAKIDEIKARYPDPVE